VRESLKGIELCHSVNPIVAKILESRWLKDIAEAFRIIFKHFKIENKEIKTYSTPSIPECFLYGLGAGNA